MAVCVFCKQEEGNPECAFCKGKGSAPVTPPQPSSSVSAAPIKPAKIDLVPKVQAEKPRLVELAQKASMSLKSKELTRISARVGLVLDVSGSMFGMYTKGRVQEVVDRILPLALHFDDDGQLDTWAFSRRCMSLTPVSLDNVDDYVTTEAGGWRDWMNNVNGAINYEPSAIWNVVAHYCPQSPMASRACPEHKIFSFSRPKSYPAKKIETRDLPAYVIFISDGGVGSDKEIEALLVESSGAPIFWQFVGLGGSNYGVLEHLDTMSGRFIDNANFFALDDLHDISDDALYDRLLGEFPDWLTLARSHGIIQGG